MRGLVAVVIGGAVMGTAGVATAGGAAKARAKDPLDLPAFTAAPSELLAAAAQVRGAESPLVVLREEVAVTLDAQGAAHRRWRCVFWVRTQQGLDLWSSLNWGWEPWHADRPVMRARVVDPSGQVREIDPAQINESASPGAGADGARRLLVALPRLVVGAVVEELVEVHERAPAFAGGVADLTAIGGEMPMQRAIVSYDAPVGLHAHHVARGLPAGVTVAHTVQAGRERWVVETGPLPARPDLESHAPSDVTQVPYVGLGTGASWAAVARAYAATIDRQIAAGPVAAPPGLPPGSSLATAQAAVTWLRGKVRVRAGDLGEGGYAPAPPAEVLRRGEGDEKDVAALLCAALRAAQIRADVALVMRGVGIDVDPDAPGLGSFDHAIVRARIADRDVWIDPSEDLVRAGQLPGDAQGRRALLLSDGTRDLVITPRGSASDNLVREVRTFVAAELGNAKATEVARESGVFEAGARAWLRDPTSAQAKQAVASYVKGSYVGQLESVATSDVADLSRPFESTISITDAARVYTERETLSIYLFPSWVLSRLPDLVKETAKETSAPPRTRDFLWPISHVYEVENRIVVPPGFSLPAPTPDRTVPVGPATFSERRRVDGRTLVVTLRFDTGKPRITAAELAAVKAGVRALMEERITITLEHTAYALGYAGKVREALAEAERLIALHPREALHRSDLAVLLLRAGLGEAARRVAREAAALEPADADAQLALGWILSHDTIGRQFMFDWDRAGALAALTKARSLGPKHRGAAVELAHVLERNPAGFLAGEGADLRGAAEAWRAALALEKDDDAQLGLARVLCTDGQFAAAEEAAMAASASEARNALVVAATAAARGTRAGVDRAAALVSGAARATLIGGAGWYLMAIRAYAPGLALLEESGALAQMDPVTAAGFRAVVAVPVPKPGITDPKLAVRSLYHALFSGAAGGGVGPAPSVFWDPALGLEILEDARGALTDAVRSLGGSSLLYDAMVASTKMTLSGDGGVWRAAVETFGKPSTAYFATERGGLKVIGDAATTAAVGRYLLATTTDARHEATARQLLDWLRADVQGAVAADLAKLWGPGMPTSRDAIRLAAAVLARDTAADRVIPVATQCASTLPDAAALCQRTLVFAHARREEWGAAAAAVDSWVAAEPARAIHFARFIATIYGNAGRHDEARRALDAALAKDPSDAQALSGQMWAAAQRGDLVEARRLGERLTAPSSASAEALNDTAWFEVTSGGSLDRALELARRSLHETRARASLHTLATIEAERGELGSAITDLHAAIALEIGGGPTSGDWYVVGRIAEQLGFAAEARGAYERALRDFVATVEPLSIATLARRRLAVLGPAPRTPPPSRTSPPSPSKRR